MSVDMQAWANQMRREGVLSESSIEYVLQETARSQAAMAKKPPEYRAIFNAGLNPPSFEVLQEEIRKVIAEEIRKVIVEEVAR